MTSHDSTHQRALRLWPGVAAAVLLLLVRYVLPAVVPGTGGSAILGGFAGVLAILVWWLFFSRAAWVERLGAIVLMVAAVAAISPFVHESIANGMMGMMLPIVAAPVLCLALVAWAVGSRRLSGGLRPATLVACILLAGGAFALLRTGGVDGDTKSDFHWRWTLTPEQRLMAQSDDATVAAAPPTPAAAAETTPAPLVTSAGGDAAARPPAAKAAAIPPVAAAAASLDGRRGGPMGGGASGPAEWPGFRGAERNGAVRGVRIETDWSASPPVELWRRPIGPGWSSFAVHGDLFYTQEQRGEDEIVACYSVATGAPVWRHRDRARFWESNAGAGPRGTPTLSRGRVYSLGATGILNVLDARTGSAVWSRNAATDTDVSIPGWGFSSSPLVVGDVVIVATSGVLAAYDIATGEPRWVGRTPGGGSYSSPQLATIGGVPQVLLMAGSGARSVAPADGALLWEHAWPGAPIVQPALTPDGGVLISTAGMSGALGTRRLAVAQGPAGWTVEERWTSNGLKPYFNDFVVHEGHAYGFDGFILASIDLETGTRKWKGGRYGHGQLILLADQDLLLVLSEEGELALVRAAPDWFTEVARFPAIEGKTWNHPVLAGDVLLVRNGEEMAAFRLALARR